MDPLEFISLALRLARSGREADRRTAVGRAYYGAFHIARHFLLDCGINFSPKETFGAEIHRKVQYCFMESGNLDASQVGSRLFTLRNQRNAADYDLDSTSFKDAASTFRMVRFAPEIVDVLQRCRLDPDFQETLAKIRAYARDVLRVAVHHDGSD